MSKKFILYLILLIGLAIATGLRSRSLNKKSKIVTEIVTTKKNTIEIPMKSVMIYVPNSKKNALIKEKIEINENFQGKEMGYNIIIEKIIEKLQTEKIILKGTYKNVIYLKDNSIYLDLDSKILKSAKSSKMEQYIVYSFVNSLLSFGEAQNLILLVDGSRKSKVKYIKLEKSYKLNEKI